MPVEIRELVIRAVTTADPREEQPQPQGRPEPANWDLLVQECVRQVLSILKKKEER